jgi:HD-like signal output (HDOD) protein
MPDAREQASLDAARAGADAQPSGASGEPALAMAPLPARDAVEEHVGALVLFDSRDVERTQSQLEQAPRSGADGTPAAPDAGNGATHDDAEHDDAERAEDEGGDGPRAALAAPLPAPPPIHVDEHLDAAGSSRARLSSAELEILEAVKRRIAAGKLVLPKLPSTHATLLHLTSGDDISTRLIVEAIERDPQLAGELLNAANSVKLAAAEPARTVTAAVVRLGARNLRTLLWSMTLKATAPEDEVLARHAKESWRQSAAMARMARLYATEVGRAPEEAHMAVLLADVGKVALVATLRRELERTKPSSAPSAALLGCLFREEHEAAGAQLARNWRLPEDVVANCQQHHDWRGAKDRKLAALTSLVQRLDMLLFLGAEVAFQNAVRREEFDALEIAWPARAARLEQSRSAWGAG